MWKRSPRHAWSALVLAAITALLALGCWPAAAAASDTIDSFTIDYRVEASGVLHVKETIVYRFASSGRHGIERSLVTRERYDDGQDQVYDISNLTVDSPSGAPEEFTTSEVTADQRRTRTRVIRIGDPDRTIATPTATYVLEYDVAGALRSSGSYDELYWDATGFDWDATIKQVSVTAEVPGGAQDVRCYAGPVGSRTECPIRERRNGTAVGGAQDLPVGSGVTLGVQIKPGLVADPSPRLVRSAALLHPAVKKGAQVGAGVGGLLSLGVPLLAWRWWRRHGRDQRYLGIPPGTLPAAGSSVRVGLDQRSVVVPVAFSPPRISVAEAGLLADGKLGSEETAATLVDLAVRGALTVRRNKAGELSLVQGQRSRATAPHERVLLERVFRKGPVRKLSRSKTMAEAVEAMQDSVREQVTTHDWLRPSAPLKPLVVLGVVATVVTTVSLIPFGWVALVGLAPVVAAVTFAVVQLFADRSVASRTAAGRAYCDQVEGFRTYLSTAEADQLRFEEGEDIFSRYLPWAIVFDLTDRWERICAELVAQGRLSADPPRWFDSTTPAAGFDTSSFTSSVTTASSSASSSSGGSSSGTGSGAGSSFSSGGGSSGGGGGGGGGGSW